MLLGEVLGVAGGDVEITGLAYDSRRVTPGTLFFAVPGFRFDGHDFAPEAVQRGAAALVVERPLDLGVPEVVVDSVRATMGPAAARFHGDPSSSLSVVAVTGTNGKTTTTFMVRAMLEGSGQPCGLIGTIKVVVGGIEHPGGRTTPEAIDLQRELRAMVDAGDRACAVEASSHGLALDRCEAMRSRVAIFTNLTRDHFDFHDSMDDYFEAKIDYSHTPDSLRGALRTARELAGSGRLLCVFGCGGNRDRGKRQRMGAIASELADHAIVTSDNPRWEDPEAIIRDVLEGAGDVEWFADRREAIRRALGLAAPGDLVLIAGKGHELYQEIAGRRLPFDDAAIARELLAGMVAGATTTRS